MTTAQLEADCRALIDIYCVASAATGKAEGRRKSSPRNGRLLAIRFEAGLVEDEVFRQFTWACERLAQAGLRRLVADLRSDILVAGAKAYRDALLTAMETSKEQV